MGEFSMCDWVRIPCDAKVGGLGVKLYICRSSSGGLLCLLEYRTLIVLSLSRSIGNYSFSVLFLHLRASSTQQPVLPVSFFFLTLCVLTMRFSSTLISAAAFGRLCIAGYVLEDDYMTDFYGNFEFFTGPDPTEGE